MVMLLVGFEFIYKCLMFVGGESKTLMLMNISPAEKNASESVATLSFAQRVMSVELGQAKKRTLSTAYVSNP